MTKTIFCLLTANIVIFGAISLLAQPAHADSRQDAIAVMENLRQAGIDKKVPAEMESIEATFSKAEQYQAIRDSKNASQNYLLVIQKASILKAKYQPKKKAQEAVVPVAAATAATVKSDPAPVSSATKAISPIKITIDSGTFLRIEQRDLVTSKQNYLPLTQYLGLDVEKLADGNLSLHFNGWGRVDFADKSFNNDKADGSLTYAYLRYRLKDANADIRAGRLFVREGIISEQIDGVSARTFLPYGFGASVFGGATVHSYHVYGEKSDGKGDTIFGGRLNYRYRGVFELGLSGVYESKAPTLINYSNGDHRLIGTDLWFNPHRMVEVIGRSSYNTEAKAIAEHSYLFNIKPLERLVVSTEFNEQRDRSYQYSWSMFSGAALNPNDRSRSIGVNSSYTINKIVSVSADYKHYTRPLGNADRYGVATKLSYFENMLRGGAGYHYLRASEFFQFVKNGTERNGSSYHELRGYALYDTRKYFTAVDLLGYFFKEKISNKSSAWEAIASLGYYITPRLAVSGDISYGRNPQFTEETKGLLRLTYNTSFDIKGGK
jgi:hypothetical protein